MKKYLGLGLSILILNGCNEMSSNNPPNPKKIPYELEAHGDVRIDNYYWMRDDSRSDTELYPILNLKMSILRNGLIQKLITKVKSIMNLKI